MATSEAMTTNVTERCSACERQTPHRVTLTIRTESTRTENAAFSREPYRVAECHDCGSRSTTRMNNV
ncbi:MAG: hypothetical protein ABEH56_01930 [Salinirussus sp.]